MPAFAPFLTLPLSFEKSAEFKGVLERAEAGSLDAQIMLGDIYGEGIGVKKDEEKSFYWYQKAAEQGDAESQFNLGVC
jgi:TPR repeat protein